MKYYEGFGFASSRPAVIVVILQDDGKACPEF